MFRDTSQQGCVLGVSESRRDAPSKVEVHRGPVLHGDDKGRLQRWPSCSQPHSQHSAVCLRGKAATADARAVPVLSSLPSVEMS